MASQSESPCFILPREAWYHFTEPGGIEDLIGLGGDWNLESIWSADESGHNLGPRHKRLQQPVVRENSAYTESSMKKLLLMEPSSSGRKPPDKHTYIWKNFMDQSEPIGLNDKTIRGIRPNLKVHS